MAPDELTHLDERGEVHMVDVGGKPAVRREAVAEGYFEAAPATLDLLEAGRLPKGEALATARVAGILAAKRCDELVPLCHPLPLDAVSVRFERADPGRIRITARVGTTSRTGVEMEALCAVSLAALSLWDMTKGVDKALAVSGIRVVRKEKAGP
ncbi:MAG: cyclic pyranopterin monophosphate synthase MoaC [Planctomycetota bacterium]|jgi:cyclic pyranopterin phosphate synthase